MLKQDASAHLCFAIVQAQNAQQKVIVYGAHCDRIGSIDVANIGNVCDEVTLLSQRLKAATGRIPILAHLPHHNLSFLSVL